MCVYIYIYSHSVALKNVRKNLELFIYTAVASRCGLESLPRWEMFHIFTSSRSLKSQKPKIVIWFHLRHKTCACLSVFPD